MKLPKFDFDKPSPAFKVKGYKILLHGKLYCASDSPFEHTLMLNQGYDKCKELGEIKAQAIMDLFGI